MSCDECWYAHQKGYDRGREQIAVAAVIEAADHLARVLDLFDYLWQWGDGYGAWVTEVVEDALAAHGFQRYQPEPKPKDRNQRKAVSPGKIVAAMQKSNGVCVACGTDERLQVDHIIPVSRGGTNDLDNLQMLCKSCNASKRDKTMDEWQGRNL